MRPQQSIYRTAIADKFAVFAHPKVQDRLAADVADVVNDFDQPLLPNPVGFGWTERHLLYALDATTSDGHGRIFG